MRDIDLTPMPPPPQRSVLRWVLLALNTFVFAIIVFAYPLLAEAAPQVFANNIAWLAIPLWALLLLLHTIIVSGLDLREGILYSRRERRRRKRYSNLRLRHKRQKMLDSVRPKLPRHPTARDSQPDQRSLSGE